MKKGIIGKKIGMTQVFDQDGNVIPVTVIQAGPCTVVQKKTVEKDGYSSVQLGYADQKENRVTKPMKGHFDKAGVAYKRVLKEFRLEDAESMNVGDVISVDTFEVGSGVDVTGISKGKGFAGTIKRYNGHRGPMTHGGGPTHRHAGSMGACSSPSRIYKGKKMPGHMGAVKVTVQNLDVVKVDTENNLLVVKGAIPGPKGSVVTVKSSVKAG